MDSESSIIDLRPRWLQVFTDLVRPGGIALMFFFLTILPLIFAFLEIGIQGVGTRLAGVLAGYFKAIPDIFYTTLQVMFVGYIAGKSGETIAKNIASRPSSVVDQAKTVNVNQKEAASDPNV